MHEMSHSWTGNLITNATWKDFWLNEGFTVFLEYKMLGREIGQEKAEIMFGEMLYDLIETTTSNPSVLLVPVQDSNRNPD